MNYMKLQIACLLASLCLSATAVQARETADNPSPERTECHEKIYKDWKEWWTVRNDQSPMDYALSNQANEAIKKCAHKFGTTNVFEDAKAKRDCLRGARQQATKAGDHIIAEAITRDLMKNEKIGGLANNPKVTVPATMGGTFVGIILAHKWLLPGLRMFLQNNGY